MAEGRSVLKIVSGTPIGKRLLGRPKGRWEDNIRMNLKGIGVSMWGWVDSAQDRDYKRILINAALILGVP